MYFTPKSGTVLIKNQVLWGFMVHGSWHTVPYLMIFQKSSYCCWGTYFSMTERSRCIVLHALSRRIEGGPAPTTSSPGTHLHARAVASVVLYICARPMQEIPNRYYSSSVTPTQHPLLRASRLAAFALAFVDQAASSSSRRRSHSSATTARSTAAPALALAASGEFLKTAAPAVVTAPRVSVTTRKVSPRTAFWPLPPRRCPSLLERPRS